MAREVQNRATISRRRAALGLPMTRETCPDLAAAARPIGVWRSLADYLGVCRALTGVDLVLG